MKRYGQVIRLRPGMVEEYRRLHAAVPQEVLATIQACGIRDYSIWIHDLWLFASFEYHGADFEADMKRMAADPATQRWWKRTEPCQEPVDSRAEGEWWASMEEIFRQA